jgi:tRNA pseudouridine38-40 synthase
VADRIIRLDVAYDGTDFSGWQLQPAVRTVQGVLEEALAVMEGGPVRIHGSGRTDAGVHARGQVCHLVTAGRIPVEGYRKGLNARLPADVAILEAREEPPGFHARFSARGKHYQYTVWNAPERHPLLARYAWHRKLPLDVAAMQAGAAHLLGVHDFDAFRAVSCEREHAVRHLWRLDVGRDGDLVRLDVEASGFLKHMVRVLAGSLVEVGRGKAPPAWIAEVLASRDRRRAGPTAPACGLCLETVYYEPPPAALVPGPPTAAHGA